MFKSPEARILSVHTAVGGLGEEWGAGKALAESGRTAGRLGGPWRWLRLSGTRRVWSQRLLSVLALPLRGCVASDTLLHKCTRRQQHLQSGCLKDEALGNGTRASAWGDGKRG